VVDEIARRRGLRLAPTECNAAVGRLPGDSLVLAEPHTFMNRSGYAARCLLERYGFELEDVLVVYDEVALPLGRLRLRPGGSPAGHRGLESVIAELRSDRIPRLRLGIGGDEPPEDLVEYVLAAFDGAERDAAEEMVRRAADACEAWLDEGMEAAMNRFNA
jgi:PTH1 family peptidyl-tRNA hydrolase